MQAVCAHACRKEVLIACADTIQKGIAVDPNSLSSAAGIEILTFVGAEGLC